MKRIIVLLVSAFLFASCTITNHSREETIPSWIEDMKEKNKITAIGSAHYFSTGYDIAREKSIQEARGFLNEQVKSKFKVLFRQYVEKGNLSIADSMEIYYMVQPKIVKNIQVEKAWMSPNKMLFTLVSVNNEVIIREVLAKAPSLDNNDFFKDSNNLSNLQDNLDSIFY